MLRITQAGDGGSSMTLRVEGRISGEYASLLDCESRKVMSQGKTLVLDFSNVIYIDSGGVAVLRRLSRDGVQIVCCNPLVQNFLSDEPWTAK